MKPSNSSGKTGLTVLWAVHDRYPTPHVVRAWSQGLAESYDLIGDIEEAKEWMENWGDNQGWRYWTTVEWVPEPAVPADVEEFV